MPEQPSMGETPRPSTGSDIEELARRLGGFEHLEPEAWAHTRRPPPQAGRGVGPLEPSPQKEQLAAEHSPCRAVEDRHETGPGRRGSASGSRKVVARAEAKGAGSDRTRSSTDRHTRPTWGSESGTLYQTDRGCSAQLETAFPTSCRCLVAPNPRFDCESKRTVSPEKVKSSDDERRLVEADLGCKRIVGSPAPLAAAGCSVNGHTPAVPSSRSRVRRRSSVRRRRISRSRSRRR